MKIYDVKDFGAIGDGETLNTEAIQSAIDECSRCGGGRVLLDCGVFMSGSITLRDGVDLHIEHTAVLLGSPRVEDYPEKTNLRHVNTYFLPRWRNASFIFAEESKNISITGRGTIDCNGKAFTEPVESVFQWKYRRINAPTPPRVVFLTGCENVLIEGITMTNQPAGWSYWIHDCDYVCIDKITINADVDYPNNDGVHINSSRHVTLSNSNITCGDDCIVIRANNVSLAENKVCEHVTVTNCNLTSYSSGVRIAWAQDGVIRNCSLSNIVMTDTSIGINILIPNNKRTEPHPTSPTSAGGADVGREATLVENISFSNIVMGKQCSYPVYLRIDKEIPATALRNIYFSGLHSRGPELPLIEGREDCHIKNIRFSDCSFTVTDGSEFTDVASHGCTELKDYNPFHPMHIKYADNVIFNNTSISME
jgi:polygalacturonase